MDFPYEEFDGAVKRSHFTHIRVRVCVLVAAVARTPWGERRELRVLELSIGGDISFCLLGSINYLVLLPGPGQVYI